MRPFAPFRRPHESARPPRPPPTRRFACCSPTIRSPTYRFALSFAHFAATSTMKPSAAIFAMILVSAYAAEAEVETTLSDNGKKFLWGKSLARVVLPPAGS